MDNEWKWKLLPTRAHTANRRASASNSSLRVLGKDRKRVGFVGIIRDVFDFARSIQRNYRGTERTKQSKEKRKLAMFMYIHVLTIIIATSYITLGIFAPETASSLWMPYAAITLILAVINLRAERNRKNG